MYNIEIPESELILNPDGSIYHLALTSDMVADDVIVVGDQERVQTISKYFDQIEFKVQHREFVTHTGTYKGKRLTVLSTGIGTDNIDIVLNELDATVNIDLKTRKVKPETRSLNIIRLGTSGALNADITVDSMVLSEFAVGFDGLVHFYERYATEEEKALESEFYDQLNWDNLRARPYATKADTDLVKRLQGGTTKGITLTSNGFYGPQGRELRLKTKTAGFSDSFSKFKFNEHTITNFEMETSAIYALGNMLGHKCCTICVIIANRMTNTFSKDYKSAIEQMIVSTLDKLTT